MIFDVLCLNANNFCVQALMSKPFSGVLRVLRSFDVEYLNVHWCELAETVPVFPTFGKKRSEKPQSQTTAVFLRSVGTVLRLLAGTCFSF